MPYSTLSEWVVSAEITTSPSISGLIESNHPHSWQMTGHLLLCPCPCNLCWGFLFQCHPQWIWKVLHQDNPRRLRCPEPWSPSASIRIWWFVWRLSISTVIFLFSFRWWCRRFRVFDAAVVDTCQNLGKAFLRFWRRSLSVRSHPSNWWSANILFHQVQDKALEPCLGWVFKRSWGSLDNICQHYDGGFPLSGAMGLDIWNHWGLQHHLPLICLALS